MSWIKRLFGKAPVSRTDHAVAKIDSAAEQFREAAEAALPPQARLFWDLAAVSADLRAQVLQDPSTITPLRRLIFFYLPKMAQLSQRWAQLAKANPLEETDAEALAGFQSYLIVLRRAHAACLSRQYDDLSLAMDTLETQLKIGG